MAKINPNDDKWKDKGGKMEPVGSCTGDFVALGFEHFEINGKSCVEIRSLCVSSTTGVDDGKELRDLFFLHSDGALTRIVKFAKDGCGWREPFDPEDPRDIAAIIGNRPFRAKVKATQNGEYVKHETGWDYFAPKLEKDPGDGTYLMTAAQLETLENGRKVWDGYLKWRADNPRDGSGGGNRGGNSGGGNSGNSSSGGGNSGGGNSGGEYDDIPF